LPSSGATRVESSWSPHVVITAPGFGTRMNGSPVVEKLQFDPSVANYFAQHPEASDHFSPAWREAQDLTPAITPPKI